MRQAVAFPLLAALAACGGGGATPATPSAAPVTASGWAAGTTLQLVSGETGAPVAGALVMLAGSSGVTAGDGRATVGVAAPGVDVEIAAAGFLPRRTTVRAGETRFVLWPDTPAFPGEYTRSLVYTNADDTQQLSGLRRLPSGVRSVSAAPAAELQADAEAMDALRLAVDAIEEALAGQGLRYVLGGATDFTVPLRVDPADSSCVGARRATTRTWLGGTGEISQAEVVFCGAEFARSVGTATHELGHTLGLRHSADERDLMNRLFRSSRSTVPTGRETLALAMLLQRRPGTVWPDDDRTTVALSRGVVEEVE